MKRYIVTEQELENIIDKAMKYSIAERDKGAEFAAVTRMIDVCRARPVPEWATHFVGKIDDGEHWVETTQEISK